ncbi:The GLUG motif-containing protein [Natronorubrum texcoconense]|uniref:The GLUG motif-containing protein n=1 Tax=Natronorubrum texcoconense TaxID=1095776 RepID=A0A1G9BPV3_9EURY|nr:The GLUG motif-containing protein [Natronorubrum texcoconense]
MDDLDGEGTTENPYKITEVDELQLMNEDLSAHYVLEEDIGASETETWNGGAGFEPIGDRDSPFSGSFDGQDHAIEDLTINRAGEDDIALFGATTGPVESVYIEDAFVSGDRAAVVVSYLGGDLRSVYASGEIETERGGGLVRTDDRDLENTIERSGSDVAVRGGDTRGFGGIIGNGQGNIEILNSYATGEVEAEGRQVGGLVGTLGSNSAIRNSYATGSVTGDREVGGLVGNNEGPVTDVFALGTIRGNSETGALAGVNQGDRSGTDGSITNGYWNAALSNQNVGDSNDDVGTSIRTNEITGSDATDNLDIDFDNFWTLTDDYPVLEWQVQDLSIALDDSTVGEGQQTGVTVTLTLDDGSTVTASEVADYDAGGIVDVDAGVVDANQQGTTEITATVADQSDSAELEVVEPPNIELEESDLDADAVVEGSPLTATATYENDGGPGSHTAELTANGEVVDTQTVSLEADAETDVDFEWTPDGPVGTEYDVSVDGADLGSVAVVEPGTISLADISVPEEVGSGEPYEFTVDLENAADETVIDTVEYELESQTAITEPVAVDSDGSTATLGYETDVDTGLTVVHAVTVDDETLEATSQVTEPPLFDVTDVESPEDVESGDEFDLSVTVENTGGVEGTQSVTVSDNDSEIATEELTLEADSSETISLAVSEDATGEYEYTVATDDDETDVTVTVSEEADDDGADDSDGLPGFGAVVAVGALAVAVAVATLRRRN